MLNKKTLVLIALSALMLAFSAGFSAADSYKIKEGKIIFSLTSLEGLYKIANIVKDEINVDTLNLCEEVQCPSKLAASYTPKAEFSGEYELRYYDFGNLNWKSLKFDVSKELPAPAGGEPSFFKSITVKFLCMLSSIFRGTYAECKASYLG